jgi:hypothetical protein
MKSNFEEVQMEKRDNRHDTANVVMAISAVIIAVIEIARFIIDYLVR